MAHNKYDKKKIYEQAKKAIKENDLFFIEDIVAWIPVTVKTLYTWWPAGSDELQDLKELLNDNKIRRKSEIRKKLFKSDKAGELLALYRLIGTPDERRALNQQYLEMKGKEQMNVNVELIDGRKKGNSKQ